MSSPSSICISHSRRAQVFSSHQFPESKYGPRCSMIFSEICRLRICTGLSSSNKTEADTAGRNLRSATRCHVARGPLTLPSPSGRGDPFSPGGGEGEDEGCSLEL